MMMTTTTTTMTATAIGTTTEDQGVLPKTSQPAPKIQDSNGGFCMYQSPFSCGTSQAPGACISRATDR